MRMPRNPENVTSEHVRLLILEAWDKFDRYEYRIDFTMPQEQQEKLYAPYQRARKLAVEWAECLGVYDSNARALP